MLCEKIKKDSERYAARCAANAEKGKKNGGSRLTTVNQDNQPNPTQPNPTQTNMGVQGAEPKKAKAFKAPSVDDVARYCAEKGYVVDPETFVAHYESNGWMVGRTRMKNWQAAVRTWARQSNTADQTRAIGAGRRVIVDCTHLSEDDILF